MEDVQVGDQFMFREQLSRIFTVREVGPEHLVMTEPKSKGEWKHSIRKSFVKEHNMIHVSCNVLPYSHRS